MKWDMITLWCLGILGGCYGQQVYNHYFPREDINVNLLFICIVCVIYFTSRTYSHIRGKISSLEVMIDKVIKELNKVSRKP